MAADPHAPVAVRTGEARRVRSPAHRNIYANFCLGQLGAFDVTLRFFQTVDAEGTGTLVHEEQATVTMSPIQFKLFAQLCTGLTEAYEKTFVPIVVPAGTGNPHLTSGALGQLMLEAKAKMEAELLQAGASTSSDSSTEQKQPGKQSPAAGKKKAKKP